MSVKLGQKVKDSISGFEGIVTGISTWLYGCVRVNVAPDHLDNDGKPIEAQWFDEPQLVGQKAKKEAPAGPRADFKFKDPTR